MTSPAHQAVRTRGSSTLQFRQESGVRVCANPCDLGTIMIQDGQRSEVEVPPGFHGPAWLFCPGDRPERFEKAAAAADVVILDLEDSVLRGSKAEARRNVVAASQSLDPARTVVRVNPTETSWGAADIRALAGTPLNVVMLPKATTGTQVSALGGFAVIPICETAAGVIAAPEIARGPGCSALCWGGQDLALDLGSSPRADDGPIHPTGAWARVAVRFAAAAAGVPAIDTVWTDLNDVDGLRSEAHDAASAGFDGKLAIHPAQVPEIRRAFTPGEAEVQRARRVLGEAHRAAERGEGAAQLDGELIDVPVIRRAERLLARARASSDARE